jgi:hypothetical protein
MMHPDSFIRAYGWVGSVVLAYSAVAVTGNQHVEAQQGQAVNWVAIGSSGRCFSVMSGMMIPTTASHIHNYATCNSAQGQEGQCT